MYAHADRLHLQKTYELEALLFRLRGLTAPLSEKGPESPPREDGGEDELCKKSVKAEQSPRKHICVEVAEKETSKRYVSCHSLRWWALFRDTLSSG